jgi:hypothetical protein
MAAPRTLVDRAIVSLAEIERRMGPGSEIVGIIERLLEYGRQFDEVPCANCGQIYDGHPIGEPGQCSGFRDPN